MSVDWGSLVDEANKQPIWEGDIQLGDELNVLWWQAWDTGRMDIGVRCNLSVVMMKRRGWGGDEDVDREVVRVQRSLVSGMVGSLVAPVLSGASGDWSVDVKMPVMEEKESRAGRPYWAVGGKIVVRCAVAKELELLINGVNRFALDQGWDRKTARQRWAEKAR